MKPSKAFIILLLFSSCFSSRTVYKLINQQITYYWTGVADDESYDLFVDSSEGVWFDARLIKNNIDTFYLHGFEKGQNHPTAVRMILEDSVRSSYLGHIFIWTRAYEGDSVEIKNVHDSLIIMPPKLMLYKKAKRVE